MIHAGIPYVEKTDSPAQLGCNHNLRTSKGDECARCGSILRGGRWHYLAPDWWHYFANGGPRPAKQWTPAQRAALTYANEAAGWFRLSDMRMPEMTLGILVALADDGLLEWSRDDDTMQFRITFQGRHDVAHNL